MDCEKCRSYSIYQMITSGKPYHYDGDIPCVRCNRFDFKSDQFKPAVNQGDSADSLQQRLNAIKMST